MVAIKRSVKQNIKTGTSVSVCEAIQISIRMGVFIALAFFLLAGVWGIHQYLRVFQKPVEMSFTGTGERFIPNNTAKITFSFSDLQQDVSMARNTVIAQVEQAYGALGPYTSSADMQTDGYSIYPEYAYPPLEMPFRDTADTSPKLLGYRVTHTTTVTVKDLYHLGTILTMLTDLDPETVTGPFFAPHKEDKRYAEDVATITAIQRARDRASYVAQLSGLQLKKITRITVLEDNPHPYKRLESAAIVFDGTAQSTTVPIQPGEQQVRKTAVITYAVEDQ